MLEDDRDDFRDVMSEANDYLEDLQRTGKNIEFFNTLLPQLPNPNVPAIWEDKSLLEIVRNQLCEHRDGVYQYAVIPTVAAGIAARFSNTRKEFEAMLGLFKNAYRSKLRDDIFYWNHFNETRQGLRAYRRALRWLWCRFRTVLN